VLNTVFGVLEETETVTVPGGFATASAGSLITDISDYDRDGVPNLLDNCPTRYNKPSCAVNDPDPDCPGQTEILCDNPTLTPIDCGIMDPTTGQCDSDGNGIGDHCQTLNDRCTFLDSDFDLVVDYNSSAIPLVSNGADFDRDGVANALDNCPNRSNSDQADIDGNFIGDACELPLETGTCNLTTGRCSSSSPCEVIGNPCTSDSDCVGCADADCDGVCDYDPGALPQPDPDSAILAALDNCPGVVNPRSRCSDNQWIICDDDLDCVSPAVCAQPDTDRDRVGNACVIEAALDNCPWFVNTDQKDADADGVGDACALPVEDVVTVDPPSGTITPFTGDGSGGLYAGTLPPFTGLSNPSSALIGNLSLKCEDLLNTFCTTVTTPDILVAEDSSEDLLTLFQGDGLGGFVEALPAPTKGDPIELQVALTQPVCPSPQDPERLLLMFDRTRHSNVIAVSQPATLPEPTIGIYLPSNQSLNGVCEGDPFPGEFCAEDIDCKIVPTDPGTCTAGSLPSLVSPPGYPVDVGICDSDGSNKCLNEAALNEPCSVDDDCDRVDSGICDTGTGTCQNAVALGEPCTNDIDCDRSGLPVPGPLTAVALDDMNADGITDIVALSSGDGDPTTPNLILYMGIGNGLYYTDPTLNPTDVPDGATLITTGNINLAVDFLLPEVSLFYPPTPGVDLNGDGVLDGDLGPIVLTNILNERADLDGSGRIDGFDLVVLARSFGAVRGEDFSLVKIDGLLQFAQTREGNCAQGVNNGLPCTADIDCPDGTCANLFRRVLDNSAGSTIGTDLPNEGGICNLAQDRMTAGQCEAICSSPPSAAGDPCVIDSDCGASGKCGTCSSPGSVVGDYCNDDSDCGPVLYGLAVDINLDGMIDGEDLAIMASLFGRSL
jgi:hypothetical protein